MCNAKFQRMKLSSTSFISSKEAFAILSPQTAVEQHQDDRATPNRISYGKL